MTPATSLKCSARILALAEELGVKHFPFYVTGEGIIVTEGKRRRFTMVLTEDYPNLTREDIEDVLSAYYHAFRVPERRTVAMRAGACDNDP